MCQSTAIAVDNLLAKIFCLSFFYNLIVFLNHCKAEYKEVIQVILLITFKTNGFL